MGDGNVIDDTRRYDQSYVKLVKLILKVFIQNTIKYGPCLFTKELIK